MKRARSILRATLLMVSVVTCHARSLIAPATGRALPLASPVAHDRNLEEKPMTDPAKPRVRTVAHFDPNDIHAIVQQAAFPNRQNSFQVTQFVNPLSPSDPAPDPGAPTTSGSAALDAFSQRDPSAPTTVVRDNQPPPGATAAPGAFDISALPTNTKIAIGAGAALMLGGAIYFARKGKS